MNTNTTVKALNFVYRFEYAKNNNPLTLFLLHGMGGDEHSLVPLAKIIAPEAGILSPRGKVLENGMLRFFRRLREGVFDIEDLNRRTNELADFLKTATEIYYLQSDNILLCGYSNGANIGTSLLFSYSELFGGAILLRPMLPYEPSPLPDLKQKPVIALIGEDDPLVPVQSSARLVELLNTAHADVTIHRTFGGHNITSADYFAISQWLERYFR